MLKRFKLLLVLPVLFLSIGFNQGLVSASCSTAAQEANSGLQDLSKTSCNQGTNSSISSIIRTVISILSFVIGIAAVAVLMVSGFRIATSGGDSATLGSARSQLIYAVIGIIVAVIAQVIVHTALSKAVG